MGNINRIRQLAGLPITESVTLDRHSKKATLANGDWVELSFNPAGKNGYNIDVWYTWVEHDMMLTWDVNGQNLDNESDLNIVSVDN
jgi:hypothetical protein